jgi:hypothetical protein
MKRIICLILLAALCSACQKMEPTEYGVRFRRLPPFLFGGVSSQVINPGQTTALMPWDEIYRFDTSVKDITWGGETNGRSRGSYVHTRALDGNEVALGVTIRYRITTSPEQLVQLLQEAATDEASVRALVVAIGRADIRTFMNQLETSEFLDDKSRYEAIDKARDSMKRRLEPYGIEILGVALDDYRFERALKEGAVDASYQEKLTEIQKLREDTNREKSRIATIRAKKLQELNNAEAVVNRQVAEAEGYKKQSMLRGDGYFQAKSNEAEAILTRGKAEVEGVIEQINALSGSGGEAILKLDLAKHLIRAQPKFVVLGDSNGPGSVDVKRLDTNELLSQLGLIEAMQTKAGPTAPVGVKAESSISAQEQGEVKQ